MRQAGVSVQGVQENVRVDDQHPDVEFTSVERDMGGVDSGHDFGGVHQLFSQATEYIARLRVSHEAQVPHVPGGRANRIYRKTRRRFRTGRDLRSGFLQGQEIAGKRQPKASQAR